MPLQSWTFGYVCCHVSVAISSSHSPPPTTSHGIIMVKKGPCFANSHSLLPASSHPPLPMTEDKEEQRKRWKKTRCEEPPMTEDEEEQWKRRKQTCREVSPTTEEEEEQRKRRRKTRRSPMTEDSEEHRKRRKQKKEKCHE